MRVHAFSRTLWCAPVPLALAALLVLAAGPASSQVSPRSSSSAAAPAVAAAAKPAANYYDRRASETLKRDEQLSASPPHPLALAHPGYDVVVCEGGCQDERGPEIVYMERTPAPAVVDTAEMVPSSWDAAGSGPLISCLGGCYDTPKRYAAPPGLAMETPAAAQARKPEPR